jgi:hypothetical protein
VREAEDFFDVGGDQQDAEAVGGQRGQQLVDGPLGADVDPRVGSSAISTVGSLSSERANSSFCWLPPDSATDNVDLCVAFRVIGRRGGATASGAP